MINDILESSVDPTFLKSFAMGLEITNPNGGPGREQARELLLEVIEVSEDPEFPARLRALCVRALDQLFAAELRANADWINAEIQRGQKSEVDSE